MGVHSSLGIKLINRESKKEIILELIPSGRANDNSIVDILYSQDMISYTSIPFNIREILNDDELNVWKMNDSKDMFSESNIMSSKDALNILKKINHEIAKTAKDCLHNNLKSRDLQTTDENEIFLQKLLINNYFEFKIALSYVYGILSVGCEIDYDVQFEVSY